MKSRHVLTTRFLQESSEILKLERPMLILMLSVLLSRLGTYMVTPIYPIMLSIEEGLSLVQIGTVLAAFQFPFNSEVF